MSSAPLRFVAISGSLRQASFNSGLIRSLASALGDDASVEQIAIDWPLYNGDVEAASGLPAEVTAAAAAIRDADGLILGVTEYNYSISAPLKNALDWLSRARDDDGKTPFDGVPTGLVGAAGRMGTSRAQAHLRNVAVFLKMNVSNEELQINAFAGNIFDQETGDVVDEATAKRAGDFAAKFASFARSS